MSTANKTQNVPGPDLPSPKLKPCNEDRPTEFTRSYVSEARNAIQRDVVKTTRNKTIISLPIELVAQLIKDYDALEQDYKSLVEIHERQGSALTCEKLTEYIEIAGQVIEMNDQTMEELDKKHEKLKSLRRALTESSGKNMESQEDIQEGNIEVKSERSETGENSYFDDAIKDETSIHGEKQLGDEIIGLNEERTKGINENHRGNGVGKKIPSQGDVPGNGDKQVNKNRHKVGPNEKGEENFGVGSSRTDYAAEGNKNNVEIAKTNGKDDNAVSTKEVNGDWSDQVNNYFDENNIDTSDWNVDYSNEYYKETPTSKNGRDLKGDEDYLSGGHGGNTKENRNSRNRSYRGKTSGRNGNNRWRQNDDRN